VIANEPLDVLAYVSPEQTGRTSRVVDARSDLYSLGVLLYELATGERPFDASDAVGMIHCHLARSPLAPRRRHGDVPEMLSRVVLRLMAKNAEERYQSAAGLGADLQRCLDDLQRGATDLFELGRHDAAIQFRVSHKLHGRDRELGLLTEAFHRSRRKRAELFLLAGASGVGKSALVHELRRTTFHDQGLYLEGKFDQYRRDVPYSALTAALSGLVKVLLTSSDQMLAAWREDLRQALGDNGQLMLDLVPDLEAVIGPQPALERLLPSQAQVLFHHVFERFIGVFADERHPLVLFLDDMQWVDASTLGLLEVVLANAERKGLFVVASYRDNEVDGGHPLGLALENLRRNAVPLHSLTLEPLGVESVSELLTETLRRSDTRELAELVHRRTGGNPFFTAQLLETLHHEGLLAYSPSHGRWQWDLPAIEAAGITENVVDLMVHKLRRLPPAAQEAIRLGACIGNSFPPRLLAHVMQSDEGDVAAALGPAIRSGLLFLRDDQVRFLHDRVQQAAYSLIAEDERQGLHLGIGRLLARGMAPDERDERLFDVVSHLNQARALITHPSERLELARLNLAAAEKARGAVAFEALLDFTRISAECLPASTWNDDPALAERIHLDLAEACYLNGKHDELAPHVERVLRHTTSVSQSLRANQILVLCAMAQGKPREAARIALDQLRRLGHDIPLEPRVSHIAREFLGYKLRLAFTSERRLERLPDIRDPDVLATMEFCMLSLPPVSYGAPAAFPLVLMKMLGMLLEHGHCFLSPVPLLGFAIVLGRVGHYAQAKRYADLAWQVQERHGSKKVLVYMRSGFSLFLDWYFRPFLEVARTVEAGYRDAVEVGNLEFMAHELMCSTGMRFMGGDKLPELLARAMRSRDVIENIRQWTTLSAFCPMLQAIANLAEGTADPRHLAGKHYDPSGALERLREERNSMGLLCTATFAAYLDVVFGDGSRAITITADEEDTAESMPVTYITTLFRFVQALALARQGASNKAQKKRLASNLSSMKRWAKVAPQNLGHQPLLVAAEVASRKGQLRRAEARYEQAARAALANGAIHDAALARELYAEHHLRRGRTAIAKEQLLLARDHYREWGALGKVRHLEQRHPELVAVEPAMARAAAETHAGGVDLSSVWKATRALSGEIVLKGLLHRLMEVMVENAGAHTGVLVLNRELEGFKVEARLRITTAKEGEPADIQVLQGIALDDAAFVPRAVLDYVIRSGESVVLDDCENDPAFGHDPFFRCHSVKSLIAIPILKQSRLAGVLYLDNPLTRGAFSAERVEFLTILAGQAAISIENALLYESLERKVEERTAKLRELQAVAVESAHHAGMAEIATDVLHNVGNVLNSLHVSCHTLEASLRTSRVAGLASAAELLRANQDRIGEFFESDDKGRTLPRYLMKLSDVLAQENAHALGEVDGLRSNVARIQNVVAAQQSYAKGKFLTEDTDLAKVVDDVLSIQSGPLTKSRVRVTKSYQTIAPVPVQRTKLANALIQLLKNAEDALLGRDPDDRLVAIDVAEVDGSPCIRIRDNGVGIAAEELERIFVHGFSTKQGAHGFGLHACANAMTEMGGKVRVESAGSGRGAAFTLVFAPRAPVTQ
jgi:predicted ATPase/GAF domain-containing protein